jgi:hypothetical protein
MLQIRRFDAFSTVNRKSTSPENAVDVGFDGDALRRSAGPPRCAAAANA